MSVLEKLVMKWYVLNASITIKLLLNLLIVDCVLFPYLLFLMINIGTTLLIYLSVGFYLTGYK